MEYETLEQLRQLQEDEIARIFRVPVAVLRNRPMSSYARYERAKAHFVDFFLAAERARAQSRGSIVPDPNGTQIDG